MEIKEFQKKLGETLELAVKNGKIIHVEEAEAIFSGDGLDEMQMQKVYDYLVVQGIQVLGYKKTQMTETESSVAQEESAAESSAEEAVLTREEREYLEDYKETLRDIVPEQPGERQSLYKKALEHQTEAKKRLAELYMTEVVEIAKELKQGDIFIGDMISEGNIGLLTGLEQLEDAQDIHAFLCGEIRNAILFMLEEHTQLKQQDEVLVEKVRDLETRIKELLEDEEGKYSVEELSAFLDMDVEEMKSVLSLTGDDK